jgi:hypothetical protein
MLFRDFFLFALFIFRVLKRQDLLIILLNIIGSLFYDYYTGFSTGKQIPFI